MMLPTEHAERAVYLIDGELSIDGNLLPPERMHVIAEGHEAELAASTPVRALICGLARPPALSHEALRTFLATGAVEEPQSIIAGVRMLAPGFTHVAIEAHGLVNGPSTEASSALLDDAARRLAVRLDGRAPHEDPHMVAWRDTYTAFGSKPSRTRNSAEALAKRALTDAGLPRINVLVDLYNAISVAHLVPVGGEDLDRIQGGMRLVRATGAEDPLSAHPCGA
jgi:hypothetical protein